MKVIALDFETSIGTTIHEATFRDSKNDIYTQIWANAPDDVKVLHNPDGFKRKLASQIDITNCDIIVGHNIGFDLAYAWEDTRIQEFLIKGGQLWDCQVSEYLLTGQQHKFSSLAELQLKYLGEVEKPSLISKLYKSGIGADRIVQKGLKCRRLWKLYNEYCRTDGSTPLKIFKAQYIRAKQEGMLPIIKLYNDYLVGLTNMSVTGIKLDMIKCEKTIRDFNIKHIELLQKLQQLIAKKWDKRLPEFCINSPDHRSAILFGGTINVKIKTMIGYYKNGNERYSNVDTAIKIRGFGVNTCLSNPLKKDGLYATTDGLLKEIALNTNDYELKEFCELQKKATMYKKAAKTYCQAWLDRQVDGYLLPNFNNTITPTGRPSSSDPNLQNVTKKNELAKPLWSCFTAPKGWTCVTIDFAQLEKWVQALVSKDSVLIKALKNGDCLHCKALAGMTGQQYEYIYQKAKIEKDEYWDRERTLIKPVSFLMDYGGGVNKVVETTGIDRETVQRFYDIDKETYKEKHQFFEETLPIIVKANMTVSREINVPRAKKKGHKFNNKGVELLPIFDKQGNVYYNDKELRFIGFWKTSYNKKYCFAQVGRETKIPGKIQRSFEIPKFKNYPNQGGAADIQAATTAELLKALITKKDKIRMILEVHDSKLFYVRTDVLEPCLKWLKETIEDVPKIFRERFNVDVPFKFPVEIEIGEINFGEMKKWESK